MDAGAPAQLPQRLDVAAVVDGRHLDDAGPRRQRREVGGHAVGLVEREVGILDRRVGDEVLVGVDVVELRGVDRPEDG